MKKIDFKKELKHLYKPSAQNVEVVTVPAMDFLMVDGEGDPNTSKSFQDAIEVLYTVSYTLKFMIKKSELAVDYAVMPLEGLWWVDDMSKFSIKDKSNWQWTLMIMQPEYGSPTLVDKAIAEVRKKKNPVALAKIRFESFDEGKTAQIMHIGPFTEEGPTIEKVRKHIEDCNCQLSGKHHEIYLSDIRKAAPENWKTIIRQPMT